MLKSTDSRIRKIANKIKAIDKLGGKCNICDLNDINLLTFHHINDDKEFNISRRLHCRWSLIELELEKCIILCHNCHAEHHYYENIDIISKQSLEKRNSKNIYLEYGGSKCEKCDYDRCPGALTFHHINSDDKLFMMGTKYTYMKSLSDLSIHIRNEIDKCELLCFNCHLSEHRDYEFYHLNKTKIEEKILNYKEKQPKIDREEVINMYNNGYKQIDIAKHFNASKGTISDIIKKYKNSE